MKAVSDVLMPADKVGCAFARIDEDEARPAPTAGTGTQGGAQGYSVILSGAIGTAPLVAAPPARVSLAPIPLSSVDPA